MKKLISIVLLAVMFSNTAFATCDFSTGITSLPDGGYRYSKDCHVKVGEMKESLENKEKAIVEYKKAIDLKDLALITSQERTQLWMDTSFKLEERVTKIEDLRRRNDWLYFGLGALTVLASGYVAAQLMDHHR